jgi:hypothetical protein
VFFGKKTIAPLDAPKDLTKPDPESKDTKFKAFSGKPQRLA